MDPVGAEDGVGGERSGSDVDGPHVLQREEPGELLVEERLGVEAVDQALAHVGPPAELGAAEVEAGLQPFPGRAVEVRHQVAHLCRGGEGPAGQDVGEGVVGRILVVLVGSDDAVDVEPSVAASLRP